jgi:ankyrin repeat protein
LFGCLTAEEAKTLISLCRAGKLYEIEGWIAAGKSVSVPPQIKKKPLRIAIDLGFHSLVELLVRNEDSQSTKDDALSEAVSKRRLDLVQLLAANGANLRSIPLTEVLLTWEPATIRFFLDNGADVVMGAPFATAFREKVRTALRPFVEYKKDHPDLSASLQEQADRALRHFCGEGDLKWISLLLWAGANPRTRGPDLDERWADDSECHTTALLEACSKGHIEVLKKLKIDPKGDNLSELLLEAVFAPSTEVMTYLFTLGAEPNAKANGGSAALDRAVWRLGFGTYESLVNKRPLTRYELSKAFESVRILVEHGARWQPDEPKDLNSVRQILYKCEPVVTVDLVKILAGHKACGEDILEQLLDAPRMRQHLSSLGMRLLPNSTRSLKRRSVR